MSEEAQTLETGTSEQTTEQNTIMSGEVGGNLTAPQTWPDDWRTQIAGNDEKELKRLESLSSPQDIWKKYRNMESEYSKRQPRLEYSPDMPPEKLSEWRKQEGIPESPDKYNFEYDDGLVIGEADQPFIKDFAEYAHKSNLPESAVKESVRWYLERQAQAEQEYAQKNYDFQVSNLADLRQEWGPEFQGNLNALNELFTDHPDIKDLLFGAVDSEGLKIGNNAQMVRWAVDIAKKLNPTATFTSQLGEGGIKGVESRIAEIEGMMGTEAYYKNPALGQEYEKLITLREQAKPRQ